MIEVTLNNGSDIKTYFIEGETAMTEQEKYIADKIKGNTWFDRDEVTDLLNQAMSDKGEACVETGMGYFERGKPFTKEEYSEAIRNAVPTIKEVKI